MGWLTILLTLIADMPQIIQIIKEIIALIHSLPRGERRQAIQDLRSAYAYARQTGDNGRLKELHDKLCANGQGVGCSAELKG